MKDQSEVEKLFLEMEKHKPLLLMGLPPQGPFAKFQWDYDQAVKAKKQDREGRFELAKRRLRASIEAYKLQADQGRYFVHECPKGSKSWEHALTQSLDQVFVVEGPMCRWTIDKTGGKLAGTSFKKATRWVTNSEGVAGALKKICQHQKGTWQREITFEEGCARMKLKYPPKVIKAIVQGVRMQLLLQRELKDLGSVGGPDPHEEPELESYHYDALPESGSLYVKEPVIDANTGVELNAKKVATARADELAWVKKQNIYEKVDESVCWEETGRAPITLKWVDRNKGDDIRENYRSRLVVREVKSVGAAAMLPDHALFSSMPPLEALKMLCSLMVPLKTTRRGGKLSLKLTDISRAHFYGKAGRRVFVNLPEGDEEEGKCALLLRTMYGTRDASAVWQRDYTQLLNEKKFKAGKAWPSTFVQETEEIRMLVHGDDFFVLADDEGHAFVDAALKERYEFRVDGHIGPGQEKQTMTVLNRILTYHEATGHVTYEADPRHAEAIVRDLGLENAKSVSTPAEKKKNSEVEAMLKLQPMHEGKQREYRSLTMRAAFLAQDRPDIAEATKSLARNMKAPTDASWSDLKRLGRYLLGKKRLVYEYWPQRFQKEIVVYCDSDHAGCLITRRSTTGLVTMLGGH